MIETKAAFARRLGVNKSTITRAAEAGRIVLTRDGKVKVEPSLKRWHETKAGRTDVEARHAFQRGADIPAYQNTRENAATAQNNATARQPSAQLPPDGEGRTRYKALVVHYENQKIKLDMALRRGLRYPLASVQDEAAALGGMVRAAMERLIDQIAPRLAVASSDEERRRIIAREVSAMRAMVAAQFPAALRRLRKSGAEGKAAP